MTAFEKKVFAALKLTLVDSLHAIRVAEAIKEQCEKHDLNFNDLNEEQFKAITEAADSFVRAENELSRMKEKFSKSAETAGRDLEGFLSHSPGVL